MSFTRRVATLSYAVRARVVLRYLGQLGLVLGLLELVPAAVAYGLDDSAFALPCAAVSLLLLLIAIPLARIRAPAQLQLNEAMVVIVATFILSAITLAVPLASGGLSWPDALFESVSGVTTTGLSMVALPEELPASFLFARSWMQWYGGLGILVFSLFLLALQPGIAAKQLLDTEGGSRDPIETAHGHVRRALVTYSLLTLFGIGLLAAAGASPFDALIHTLSAVSTGGFSSHSGGLAGFGNGWAQAAAAALCVLGAVSLPLYYRVAQGGWRELGRNLEWRALLVACALSTVLLGGVMLQSGQFSLSDVVASAPLLAISAQTTTGFTVVDLAGIGAAPQLLLILSMSVGGSLGSTAGGIKLLRVLVILRVTQLALLRTRLPPHAAVEPELREQPLDRRDAERALVVGALFAATVVSSWLVFLLYGYPALDALFEVVSAVATVGLSTGITAPELPGLLKGVLGADMLLGRLEFVALLVVLLPGTWIGRKNIPV